MIHLLQYVDLTLHAELIQFTKPNLEANLEEIHQDMIALDREVRKFYADTPAPHVTEEYIQMMIREERCELQIEAFRLVHAIASLN